MGLDNIPHTYPCRKAGTAIEVDGRIDCEATIKASQCPWATASEGKGAPVYGLFGVPCWYRGKVGMWMLEALEGAGYSVPDELRDGFYGDKDSEGSFRADLSPEHCTALGDWMAEHIEAFATTVDGPEEREAALEQYRYAAWWLRWIAEAGDGADAWS